MDIAIIIQIALPPYLKRNGLRALTKEENEQKQDFKTDNSSFYFLII